MTSQEPVFRFYDPGRLIDGDLELVLMAACPADPIRGLVPEYKFEMRLTGTNTRIGQINLRLGLTEKLKQYGGHIGYGVQEAYRGRHYAARSCKLLFPLAAQHGIDPILITCSPDNIASRRTCELIGGELVDIIDVEIEPGKYRLTCRYHVRVSTGDANDKA